tara:strand:- start:147 stop:539 length:393 start_codon:yes stop_codon:yes gene_type:complete
MKVEKPWGHEIRWAVNDKYLGKILRIEPGQKLSRQYHVEKDESIFVLDGILILEIGQGEKIEKIILNSGGTWRIKPGTVHRFAAPSEGCTLIEVSTPEIDDVVRLEDSYGRQTVKEIDFEDDGILNYCTD